MKEMMLRWTGSNLEEEGGSWARYRITVRS